MKGLDSIYIQKNRNIATNFLKFLALQSQKVIWSTGPKALLVSINLPLKWNVEKAKSLGITIKKS